MELCKCEDPSCPHCLGQGCDSTAVARLFRADQDDSDGTPMCDFCTADAWESGLYRDFGVAILQEDYYHGVLAHDED